jgi:hypothetical protein
MFTKQLSTEDAAELSALNEAVNSAIAARTQWLDSKMAEYSLAQVGDEVFGEQGNVLGTVSRLYRYHAKHEPMHDTNLCVELEFETRPGCFDNTSRQPFKVFTKEQLDSMRRTQLAHLQRQLAKSAPTP